MQKYLILTLLLLFVGCINQQEKNIRYTEKQIASLHLGSAKILIAETDSIVKIDLNPFLKEKHFDFNSLVKEVKLLPLETSNNSLLDAIYNVVVTDFNIYIHDKYKGGGIVIFDRDGKFIRRIPNGKGPGELVRLYDIAFDKDNNELIAYQHSFLLHFTPTGKFIRQERLPFGFYNFTVIPDGYAFKTLDHPSNTHLGIFKDFTFLVTDKNFKLKSVGLYSLPTRDNYGGYKYIYNNSTIKITQNFADTIFQYISATNKLKARYVLDYNKKKLPERYVQGARNEFEIVVKKKDYYFYIGEYIETEHQIVIFLKNQRSGRTVIYRDKKSSKLIGGTNADFNLNEIPPIAFPRSASGNYFISWYYPSKNDLFALNSSIISTDDKLKAKGLTVNDNPVLVFFTLKDF